MEDRMIFTILTTFPNMESARKVCELMVRENLAACAQVGGEIESFYVWDGEFCDSKEVSANLKISSGKLDSARQRFSELHPYECPEWVELSVRASTAYAEWVNRKK